MFVWCILCEVKQCYILERLGRAAFCMEELILTNPHNYVYHLKYAEVPITFVHYCGISICCFRYATVLDQLNVWSLQESIMQLLSSLTHTI